MQTLHIFRSQMHYACLFIRFNYWNINVFFFSAFDIPSSLPPYLHTPNSTQVARHLDFPVSGEGCYSGSKMEDTQRHSAFL